MEKQRVFVFIGNSGCGKGTQAALLREKMEEKGMEIMRLELGGGFREFWGSDSYSANRSREQAERGELPPVFIAANIWSQMLLEQVRENNHLIVDGVPRRVGEAEIFDGALKFYGIEDPTIIYLNITRETAKERMMSRGRSDDDEATIDKRLDWFDRDVIPTIEYLQNNDYYDFLDISGEGTVEDIHEEIMNRVNL